MSQPDSPSTPKPRVVRQVPAVSRAIKILRFLAKSKEPIGVVQLSRELKLISSTVLHIIRVLADEGLVTFNVQTKQYTLGPGVLSFASAFSSGNPFVQLVRAHLDDLSLAHNCAIAAVEQSGPDHYIVVAVADVNASIAFRLRLGTRFPSLVSSTGQCFAAFSDMTPTQLKEGFAKLRWDDAPNYAVWLKQVQKTRVLGYAVDSGSYIRGVTIVAVPVFGDDHSILGCIASVGLREQLVDDRLAALIKSMKDVASRISREVGQDAFFDPRHVERSATASAVEIRKNVGGRRPSSLPAAAARRKRARRGKMPAAQ